jgi:cation transport regulator ChaB
VGPDRVVFLAIGLLLALALGLLILRALTPEARAWAERRAPWLLAGLAGLLWLLSFFRSKSPLAPETDAAGEGYLTTKPVEELPAPVREGVESAREDHAAAQAARAEELRREVDRREEAREEELAGAVASEEEREEIARRQGEEVADRFYKRRGGR